MTEIEAQVGENGSDGKNDETISKKIVRQVEHYFGDYNLPRDKFLLEKVKESEGGWIELDMMLKFHRLAKISEDQGVILKALKESSKLMEVDEDQKRIRRNPNEVLPEYNEERKKKLQDMCVYVKGFDKEINDNEELITFFDDYDGVLNVQMRTWTDKKDSSKKGFKGSVFVTFKTKELAEKFMDLEEVKYNDEVLIRKWQTDYFKDKNQEMAEKRKARNSNKEKAAKEPKDKDSEKSKEEKKDKKDKEDEEEEEAAAGAGAAAAEEEEGGGEGNGNEADKSSSSLPKGAVLVLDDLNEETTREIIKEKLKDDFEVDPTDIAFIYYQKGEKTAKLRFKTENAAKELEEKLKEAETFKINDVVVQFKILEGEEEEEFLKQCVEDMAAGKSRKGHKRKGGFQGGRGRKRRRN